MPFCYGRVTEITLVMINGLCDKTLFTINDPNDQERSNNIVHWFEKLFHPLRCNLAQCWYIPAQIKHPLSTLITR